MTAAVKRWELSIHVTEAEEALIHVVPSPRSPTYEYPEGDIEAECLMDVTEAGKTEIYVLFIFLLHNTQ